MNEYIKIYIYCFVIYTTFPLVVQFKESSLQLNIVHVMRSIK